MILSASGTYPLGDFIAGLQSVARSLVWVEVGAGGCTGWVIAPGLVVIPGYALSTGTEPQRIACRAADGTATAPADVVYTPPPDRALRPALLRLTGDLPVDPLALDLSTPMTGRHLLVLHHPQGQRHTQLSLGRVLSGSEPGLLRHDATTTAGSGGAPVVAADTMKLVGMHVKGNAEGYNEAVPIATLLDELHGTPFWPEIAVPHRLADLGPVESQPAADPSAEPALLPFALRWNFDPAGCTEAERTALRLLVSDPEETTWSVLPDERRNLIKAAEVLPPAEGGDDHPGQRAIDRILAGPPFDLAAVDEDELPFWLQAVGWFAGAVPDLPSPADVHRELAGRRVRSRLHAMIGRRLWGRASELDRMRRWHANPGSGPLLITGVGGVGKSALIAEFARGLPPRTVLLWLDFDRADLAPDDADSVLGALAEQLTVQLDANAGPVPPTAQGLAALLETLRDRTPLLVLDGFEIAQHAPRHEEIWTVLAQLLGPRPALHVVVSGRADVPGLALGGHRAEPLILPGLAPPAAEAWLRDQGVTDPATLTAVLATADGVPLILKLATRLIEAGGDVADIPQQLVEGYLYQRILDRVVDLSLRPLAHDALVLRRLTAPMLSEVLGDRMPPRRTPETVLEQLARELTVAEGQTPEAMPAAEISLRMRPEVRTATLRLLERENPDRVREIDTRAASWYASHGAPTPVEAAEHVYHLLRLGDVAGAAAAWSDGCAGLLLQAEEEIPEQFPQARAWLRDRTGDTAVVAEVWEPEMYAEVRHLVKRDNLPAAAALLASRIERSPDSPLLEYDAWLRFQLHKDLAGARAIIGRPERRSGRVLAAWLAEQDSDPRTAEDLLSSLDSPSAWQHKSDPQDAALAVRAARIRLTVNLDDEERLTEAVIADTSGELAIALRRVLVPGDVLLPSLSRALEGEVGHSLESLRNTAPATAGHADLLGWLAEERLYRTRTDDPRLRIDEQTRPAWTAQEVGLRPEDVLADGSSPEIELGFDLAVRATWRWSLVLRDSFLADLDAATLVVRSTLALTAARALSVFHGQPLILASGRSLKDVTALSRLMLTGLGFVRSTLNREQRRLAREEVPYNVLDYLLEPAPLSLLTRIELAIPETLKDERQ